MQKTKEKGKTLKLKDYAPLCLTLITPFFTNLGYIATIRMALTTQFGDYCLGIVDVVVIILDILLVITSILFSQNPSLYSN